MLGALIVLAVVLVVVLVLGHLDRVGHRRHIEHLLAAQDAERHAWDRQRWELMTRIQSPELVRQAPIPPPPAPGVEVPVPPVDTEPDESHLIGMIGGQGA